MDFDKLIATFKAVGFPTAIAIWFLWKIQGFMEAMVANQAAMVELLRQLVEMHK